MYVEVNYEKQAMPRKIWKPIIGRELVSFRIPCSMQLKNARTNNFRGKDYTFFKIEEEGESQTYQLFNALKEVFEIAGLELEHTYYWDAFMLRGAYHIEANINTISVYRIEGFESEDTKEEPSYVAKLVLPETYYT